MHNVMIDPNLHHPTALNVGNYFMQTSPNKPLIDYTH
jgi:hypothetical protein